MTHPPLTQTNDDSNNPFWKDLIQEQEEDFIRRKAALNNLQYINLKGYPFEVEALRTVPREIIEKYKIFPFKINKDSKKISLAVLDYSNKKIKDLVKDLETSTGFNFEIFLASDRSLEYAIKSIDSLIGPEEEKTSEDIVDLKKEIKHLSDLKEEISKVSVTKMVDVLLNGALAVGASDIHIEPREKDVRIRYRLDGVLQDVVFLPKDVFKPITSRIKFLSGLKLDVTRIPQDGKFHVYFKNQRVDIRTSTLPTMHGETIVMRLFGSEATSLQVESLGLLKNDFEILSEVLKKTHGMILITGPTGSGKTTTLYAILNKLSRPQVKIITLEDPIEYHLANISQSQVDPEKGYTFASGLRAILRQDPDIVMVGEIRDFETAEIAVQAALTGHIVLSTVHTNDAPSAIPRLTDIGVKSFLLAQALSLVIAQRLVRKICSACREKIKPDKAYLETIKEIVAKMPSSHRPKKIPEYFYHGKGCSLCNNTGYKGRIGIFELFLVDREVEEQILKKSTVHELKEMNKKKGMLTMEQDGILKVIDGITTLEEVQRVTLE